MRSISACDGQRRLCSVEFLLERRKSCDVYTALLRGLFGRHRAPVSKHVNDRQLGARLRVYPLVRIEPCERASRTDIDQSRSILDLRARIGEIELL